MRGGEIVEFESRIARVVLISFAIGLSGPPATAAAAEEREASRQSSPQSGRAFNLLFAHTHLLPNPYTLPAGRLAYGTELAFGFTDFLQVGTSLIRDFYKIFNANIKVSLLNYPKFAAAATLGAQAYNLRDFNASTTDLWVTSWLPGAVVAYELVPRLALFLGGNAEITSPSGPAVSSGYVHGGTLEADLSWAYGPAARKRGASNVLSAGVTLNVTHNLVGFGLSHHWPGFQLGVHYYPAASQHRVLPIIVGGGAIDL